MINLSKIKAMIFTMKYEFIKLLKLWDKEIEFTNLMKYLGVCLDIS